MLAELLTIEGFCRFGSIVSPDEEISKLDSSAKNANQGTAFKLLKISQLQNSFGQLVPTPSVNIFRCFPQIHLQKKIVENSDNETITHEVRVLEKHPFSSQTFIPMGGSANEIAYLIVVANSDLSGEPDLTTLKAFICRGNQAVTYGAGVWHAPMIVVGTRSFMDFTVVIYELLDGNHPEKDCVERLYKNQEVVIEMSTINPV
ncbi:LAMI_0E08394g1_1 [Lachancea mirantina]|uniref:LAMI_0E08394g1_1 n=1 Tax=Lachancea mirantina TaxID=1230905 RepID=A0A1G4JMX5_9SACH|nr:LAMI_0E08394g1_1 [Lachancea mirantina]